MFSDTRPETQNTDTCSPNFISHVNCGTATSEVPSSLLLHHLNSLQNTVSLNVAAIRLMNYRNYAVRLTN
jgi:hypothetical protein